MALNPMALLQMKERFRIFKEEHPKVLPFLNNARKSMLVPGTIMELRFKKQDGEEMVSNIKLTKNDVETIESLLK